MLILQRKPGEGFWIGADVEIVILKHDGAGVKIGVRAPRDVLILRTELKATEEQNRASAGACPSALDTLAARLRRAPAAAQTANDSGACPAS
jgi:carbon storage regulator